MCEDRLYAQEVVHVLPHLRHFDGCDLQSMQSAYAYSHTLRSSQARLSTHSVTQRGRASTPTSRKRLPDLPAQVAANRRPAQDPRHDFERRLRSALAHRHRGAHAAAVSLSAEFHERSRASSQGSSRFVHPGGADRMCVDVSGQNDEDQEMLSVEESIQELSRSFSGRRRTPTHSSVHSKRYSSSSTRDSSDGDAGSPDAASESVHAATSRAAFKDAYPPTIAPTTAPALIRRWANHPSTKEVIGFPHAEVPVIHEDSTLLDGTESLRLRRQLHGVADRSTRFPQHPGVRLVFFGVALNILLRVFLLIQHTTDSALYSTASLRTAPSRRRSGDGSVRHSGFSASGGPELLRSPARHCRSGGRGDGSGWKDGSAARGYFSESEAHSNIRLSARKAGQLY